MNFLKNDAAAHYAASSTAIHSNNYKRIKELTTEALEFIEKDLDFGEKVCMSIQQLLAILCVRSIKHCYHSCRYR